MIVSCPSCGTRYSHQFEELQAALACCSHCEGMVPLVKARRPYVLIPSTAAPGPVLHIGMDDPQLAEKLTATAVDDERGKAAAPMIYRVAAAGPASQGMKKVHAGRFGSANGAAPAIFKKRPAWWNSPAAGKEQKRALQPAEQGRNRKQEVAVAVVLSAIGGSTAYYSAVEQGLNPFTWIVAGGALGLFMAWVCIRWTRRS